MWPFKKKAKQSEPKIDQERPLPNFEVKVKVERWTEPPKEPEPKIEEENPQQDCKLKMIIDPVTKKVTFKPEEPKSPAKEPENPLVLKLECPTCKKSVEKQQSKQSLERTSRNRFKCPHCKNWIYFLGDNPVTQLDHERLVEKYYQTRYQETHKLRQPTEDELADLGLTAEMLRQREQELLKSMGVMPKKPSVIMSLFNESISKVKDLNEMESRYHSVAIILNKAGEDCLHILKAAAKTKLAALKKEGYRNVSIMTSSMCEECKKVDGKVLPIDEAVKTMPIPIRQCKNHPYSERHSFCICEYMSEVDDEYWKDQS